MSDESSKIWKVAVPMAVLLLAAGIATAFVLTRPEPARKAQGAPGVLVRTVEVEAATVRRTVRGRGEVIPARPVVLRPQVPGAVVEVHDELIPGGLVAAGEVLFRIEPADYRLAVEEAETAVERARAELRLEEGRQVVAEREWQLFQDTVDPDQADPSLALREPQLRAARVAVDAAQSRLRRARLDLSRTEVAAPFDALVLAEEVEVGQLVGPETAAVRLVASDAFRAEVLVPVELIGEVEVPGAPVVARQSTGRGAVERPGRVLRLVGDLDPAGRMARLLVRIDDPLALDEGRDGPPMLLGSFVEVEIEGASEERVVEVPPEAIRDGDEVYLFTGDGTLEIREVRVAWRRADRVYVAGGLEGGERLVTSSIATPIDGMKLRRESSGG